MKKLVVFLGMTAVAGVMATMSNTKAPANTGPTHILDHKVVQVLGDQVIEYPSIEDAAIISNVPQNVIIESIITEKPVDGYEFRHQ